MKRTLMILFPQQEPSTNHICYEGGCAIFSKGFNGCCKALWDNPSFVHKQQGKDGCMCNLYDMTNPTIVEAEGIDINEVVKIIRNEGYDKVKRALSCGFMDFLDKNAPEGKMRLSNGECFDIDKAFDDKDWSKLECYLKKYLNFEKKQWRNKQ